MTNSLAEMPLPQLKRAIAIREKIDALTTELDELVGANGFIPGNGTRFAARALDGGKALRWTTSYASAAMKPRLSAEGRAKVSAAVKARWERFRAAKAREAARTK